jgi:hypothetical protein
VSSKAMTPATVVKAATTVMPTTVGLLAEKGCQQQYHQHMGNNQQQGFKQQRVSRDTNSSKSPGTAGSIAVIQKHQ